MTSNRNVLPDAYRGVAREELIHRIQRRKDEYGFRLVILGHHYQIDDIVDLSDFKGDSLGLSRIASQQTEAEFIVFCGVRFMAQTAAVLARPHQTVVHPDVDAGCPMADMASLADVERAWTQIGEICGAEELVPVCYVNSDAEIKAFCGRNGGIACTSSNAEAVFDWAFARREKVLFLPDEHLGRNTSKRKGVPRDRILLWDTSLALGGHTAERVRDAQLILWKGYCHVHTHFTRQHVEDARARFPDARIVVHPECVEEVVDLADADGSTEFIIRYIREAETGAVLVIGTEINLVSRLAREHPDKKIVPLARSLCPNMFRVSPNDLLWTLDHLGEVNVVTVPEDVKGRAKLAIDRMLSL